jgi:hypothetical protein
MRETICVLKSLVLTAPMAVLWDSREEKRNIVLKVMDKIQVLNLAGFHEYNTMCSREIKL